MLLFDDDLSRFNFNSERVYRAVCTVNGTNGNRYNVDFADADPKTAKLSHMHLLKLRQGQDSAMEMALPPLFVREPKSGNVSVEFAKPSEATEDNQQKLLQLTPRILCEFNKFRYRGKSSSFENVVDENTQTAAIYDEASAEEIAKGQIKSEQERSMVVAILSANVKKNPSLLPYLHLARDGD